jgi:hypothetical protein
MRQLGGTTSQQIMTLSATYDHDNCKDWFKRVTEIKLLRPTGVEIGDQTCPQGADVNECLRLRFKQLKASMGETCDRLGEKCPIK